MVGAYAVRYVIESLARGAISSIAIVKIAAEPTAMYRLIHRSIKRIWLLSMSKVYAGTTIDHPILTADSVVNVVRVCSGTRGTGATGCRYRQAR